VSCTARHALAGDVSVLNKWYVIWFLCIMRAAYARAPRAVWGGSRVEFARESIQALATGRGRSQRLLWIRGVLGDLSRDFRP
jgi:hypothetical protein